MSRSRARGPASPAASRNASDAPDGRSSFRRPAPRRATLPQRFGPPCRPRVRPAAFDLVARPGRPRPRLARLRRRLARPRGSRGGAMGGSVPAALSRLDRREHEELVDIDETEDPPHRHRDELGWDRRPVRGPTSAMSLPPGPDRAPAGRPHVAHPVGPGSVGEREDIALARSEDVHRRAVLPSRHATEWVTIAEARHPARDLAGDPVRDALVEPGQPRRERHRLLLCETRKGPLRRGALSSETGGVLLSQGISPQVPSALVGLTAVFGMGTGVAPPPWPPRLVFRRADRHAAGRP